MLMQAVRIHEHGGPEVMRPESVPAPVPAAGEALVKIHACALNHLDLFIRQGIPGVPIGLPRILGSDIAGEIAAFGDATPPPDWKIGDAVVLSPGLGCGRCHLCLAGRDNECHHYGLFGYQRDGGYAEYVAAPLRALLPKPPNLDWAPAASVPLVFLTAWNMLVRRAHIEPGQTVLVWAAASGVGIAAIQIAKLWGCRVLATAGSEEKLALARQLGADVAIHHYDKNLPVARAVKQHAPGGVDVVIEHIGEATWEQSLRALAPNGVLVTCGATTGARAAIDLRFLFARQLRLQGSYMGRRADLDTVIGFLAEGRLRPALDRVFPLAEAAAAHRALAAGQHRGKLVLQVAR